MATGYFSPIGMILQAFSDQGVVGAGYKIKTYVAGSSTPLTTYADSALTTPNGAVITLGSNGRMNNGSVWAPAGSIIKMVLTDPNDVVISGGTIDNLPLINNIFSTDFYFSKTTAETTAGVTVVNYYERPGFIERYGTNSNPGTTDMSAALAAADAQSKQPGGSPVTARSICHIASSTTIDGPFLDPGPFQIFSATSLVVFSKGSTGYIRPEWFGAKADGVTDSTTAMAKVFSIARLTPSGMCIQLNAGNYAVSEWNLTSSTAIFNQGIFVLGAGKYATKIIPVAAGGVLVNMMGTNYCTLMGFSIDSNAFASQCGLFISRTTTSANANSNTFRDFWVQGSYTVAGVCSFSAESTDWDNCRFENTNSAALYRTFITGPRPSDFPVTTVNGGTQTTGPNTDNAMYRCQFYSPFSNSEVVVWSESCGYALTDCFTVGNNSGGSNCKLHVYKNPVGGVFNGPVIHNSPHMELVATGSTVHYLDGGATTTTFKGISNFGGNYVLGNNTQIIDFDRSGIANQPILQASTWTSFTLPEGISGINAYLYGMYSCSFSMRPNNSEGTLAVLGLVINSTIDVATYVAPTTHNGVRYEIGATASPASGTWVKGSLAYNTSLTVGQPTGWGCSASGTFGTLNGGATTGGGTINTNTLTVNSATGLYVGCQINIVGIGGFRTVASISGTTIKLTSNLNATVAAAAVSFNNGIFTALANL